MFEPRVDYPVRTIEQTGKKWKALRLVGTILFILGSVIAFTMAVRFGSTIALTGAGLYLIGRVGGWWYHG